jgi:tetratricopeptide (TPR) repeat protein
MKPTVEMGGVQGLRVQDIVVKDIVQNNTWDRPIYFASTCSPDCYIGLDDYLETEGLASRLVPQRKTTAIYVNAEITKEDLLSENTSYSKTFKPGFKFRGLNNKDVFFDETESRLIQNYRNAYLELAYYYYSVKNDNVTIVSVLDMMEKKMPQTVVPMDYRLLYEVGNLYSQAGALDKYRKVANEIIPAAFENLNDVTMDDLASPDNPYSMLERTYISLKEYDKAIEILQRLQNALPNAGGVQEEINRLKQIENDTTKK